MSQSEKSELYQELRAADVQFDRHYREYSTEDFRAMVTRLHEQPGYQKSPVSDPPPEPERLIPPIAARPEGALPAEHAYRQGEDTPLRTDEQGRIWFREEVRKPATPAPRARRVLKYIDPGTTTKTIVNGRYIESFEEAGNQITQGEVRITMPSYQVGVYKDPRFPFKVHVYNDTTGFDLFDVQDFYGGSDLVPTECKRLYIGTDLCYDIRTVIRAIESEYRREQLNRN